MEQDQQAVTVSQYVWISDIIADLRIVAANQQAAKLYGFDNPNQLIGRFLSQTQTKEDMYRGCLLSLARRKGINAPSVYATHIKRLDGQLVNVRKYTHQLETNNTLLFVTFLEELVTDESPPMPSLEELSLTEAEVLEFRGVLNMAELEELVSQHLSGEETNLPLPINALHNIINALHKSTQVNTPSGSGILTTTESTQIGEPITLGPGESRQMPDGRYLHRCGRCAVIWPSDQRNPEKCPRQRTDARGPRCGTSQWRQVWPEFWEASEGNG